MRKIKSLIINLKWMPASWINKLVFSLRNINYGKKFKTYGTLFVRGRGKISIGDFVTINSCRETNPIGGDTKTILYAKEQGEISIGNHVGISNTAIIAQESVVIEDYVMIGAGCKIYDNDFHPLDFEARIEHPNDGIKSKPVTIKEGAFIGAHSIILKGVTIGQRSVIGAGSVVTKSVPDDEIWGGNPARFLKKIES